MWKRLKGLDKRNDKSCGNFTTFVVVVVENVEVVYVLQ